MPGLCHILTETHGLVLMHRTEPDWWRVLSYLSFLSTSSPSPPPSQHVSLSGLLKPEKLAAPATEILWTSRLFPMILPVAQEATIGLSHMPYNKSMTFRSSFISFLCFYIVCGCICPCVHSWGGIVSVRVCAHAC